LYKWKLSPVSAIIEHGIEKEGERTYHNQNFKRHYEKENDAAGSCEILKPIFGFSAHIYVNDKSFIAGVQAGKALAAAFKA
jgi:hypothetical protein